MQAQPEQTKDAQAGINTIDDAVHSQCASSAKLMANGQSSPKPTDSSGPGKRLISRRCVPESSYDIRHQWSFVIWWFRWPDGRCRTPAYRSDAGMSATCHVLGQRGRGRWDDPRHPSFRFGISAAARKGSRDMLELIPGCYGDA